MVKQAITDAADGLPASTAGEWAKEKHRLLAQYIDASWGARAKFGDSTYMRSPAQHAQSLTLADAVPLVVNAKSAPPYRLALFFAARARPETLELGRRQVVARQVVARQVVVLIASRAHGDHREHRVDRADLESGHGLLEGLAGLQALLRRAHRRAVPGRAAVHRRPMPSRTPRASQVGPQGLDVLCELDERLFHPDVPDEFIRAVFDVMRKCPQHTFQVLTKRSERLAQLARHLAWPNNVWMGVSVEDARVVERIDHLRDIPAVVRSCHLSR